MSAYVNNLKCITISGVILLLQWRMYYIARMVLDQHCNGEWWTYYTGKDITD